MENASNTPSLRFRGYTDAWGQERLGDIAEKVTEKNTKMEITDALTNSAEFGIIDQGDFFDHDVASKENLSCYFIVNNNDFVYNPRISVTAPVGPIRRNKLGKSGVMSPLYTVFRPHDINLDFLEQYFKSEHWHRFMKWNGNSGARSDRFAIKDEDFYNMPIPFPALKEQEKVGRLLSGIESYVSLHQRKLDKLQAIKKSLLQKMFPAEGEHRPQIRFAGYTDAWGQRSFKDIFDYERPDKYIVKSDEYEDGLPTPVLTANKGFILGYTSETNTYNNPCIIFDDFTLDSKFVNFKFMVKSSALKILTAKIGYDLYFSYELLNNSKIENLGHKRHYISVVQDTEVLCPDFEEQRKISSLFQNLDNLISLHQRKLEKLQQIKKALLEQMFC